MSKLTDIKVDHRLNRVTVFANGTHGSENRHIRFDLSTGPMTFNSEAHKLHIGVGAGTDASDDFTWIEVGLDDLVHVLEELFDVTIDIPEPKKLG